MINFYIEYIFCSKFHFKFVLFSNFRLHNFKVRFCVFVLFVNFNMPIKYKVNVYIYHSLLYLVSLSYIIHFWACGMMKVPIGNCGILPKFLPFFQMSKSRKFMNIDRAVEFLKSRKMKYQLST